MNNQKKIICIVCPIGCRLTVKKIDGSDFEYKVTDNKCKRGEVYGLKEMVYPTRIIPTTVVIENAHLKRMPVKTDKPIGKELIFEAMKEINKSKVSAPIKLGEVIIENILGTDVNIVATRSMDSI